MQRALLSFLSLAVLIAACAPEAATSSKKKKKGGDDDDDPSAQNGGGDDDDGSGGNPPLGTKPSLPTSLGKTGTIEMTLTADKGAASDDVVSLGVPFPQGIITDAKNVTVLDASGKPVKIFTKSLATWPGDNSIRSVLVAFKTSLGSGETAKWKVEYGSANKGGDAGALEANPDGPVTARLTAEHYGASLVSGPLLPRSKNQRFAKYEDEVDRGDGQVDLSAYPWDDTSGERGDGTCNGTQSHRTYYDGPHARFQLALRSDDAARMRAAHNEAVWYRTNELEWVDSDKKMAITKCEAAEAKVQGITDPWTPERPLDWSTLRMMAAQGMLDDYLVTGDPKAKEALAGLGEAYIANLPALQQGTLHVTERNLGWTIMGIVSYYAINHDPKVKEAAEAIMKDAYDWQGPSGAFEHDINRPDPGECSGEAVGEPDTTAGPKGSSPFMTSLAIDGMMDWWLMTNDPKMKPFMEKMAAWYENEALAKMPAEQGGDVCFKYLWGCIRTSYDPSTGGDPDGATSPELNILINHVFGGAWAVTGDKRWIELGDKMADAAISGGGGEGYMFLGMPKAWNQQNRSFGKYLGYRALSGATP